MPEVIKDAFFEGRLTEVSYENSQAKRDQIALAVFVHNEKNFNQHELKKSIP